MKNLLDSNLGSQTLEKMYDDLYTLLNPIAQGNHQQYSDIYKGAVEKTTGMIDVDSVTTLVAQFSALQNNMMAQFSNFDVNQSQAQVNAIQQTQPLCEIFGNSGHSKDLCEIQSL